MKMHSRALLTALSAGALLAQLAACGEDPNRLPGGNNGGADAGTNGNPDSGTNNNTQFDLNAVSAQYASSLCGYQTRCQPLFRQIATESQCITDNTEFLREDLGFLEAAITAGRITYSKAQLDACTAAIATADCALDFPAACDQIFTGTQPANAACFTSAECAGGHYCDGVSVGGCGTCKPYAARDADCSEIPCGDGLDCFNTGGANPVCLPVNLGENAPCGTIQTGLCQGGLQCVGPEMGSTCQRAAGANAACDPMVTTGPDCDIYAGHTCNNGMCVNVSLAGLNEQCGGTTLCREGYCPQTTMTCTALPGAGQPCIQDTCNQDAYCGETDSCLPLKPEGTACEGSFQCTGDLYCIGLSATMGGSCGALNWMQCN